MTGQQMPVARFRAGQVSSAEDATRYSNAVRTFYDNVLTHGRDTYGKKTPLFADGLDVDVERGELQELRAAVGRRDLELAGAKLLRAAIHVAEPR